jgi:hypothetical protein
MPFLSVAIASNQARRLGFHPVRSLLEVLVKTHHHSPGLLVAYLHASLLVKSRPSETIFPNVQILRIGFSSMEEPVKMLKV